MSNKVKSFIYDVSTKKLSGDPVVVHRGFDDDDFLGPLDSELRRINACHNNTKFQIYHRQYDMEHGYPYDVLAYRSVCNDSDEARFNKYH
jgi:hypothetical protein